MFCLTLYLVFCGEVLELRVFNSWAASLFMSKGHNCYRQLDGGLRVEKWLSGIPNHPNYCVILIVYT